MKSTRSGTCIFRDVGKSPRSLFLRTRSDSWSTLLATNPFYKHLNPYTEKYRHRGRVADLSHPMALLNLC